MKRSPMSEKKGKVPSLHGYNSIEAERKNRLEAARLAFYNKFLELEKLRNVNLIDRHKRDVVDELRVIWDTTGLSAEGLVTSGPEESQRKNSVDLDLIEQVSDKRLKKWRQEERNLQRILLAQERKFSLSFEEDHQDRKSEMVKQLMTLMGYDGIDIHNRLHVKSSSPRPYRSPQQRWHKISLSSSSRPRTDVFQCLRSDVSHTLDLDKDGEQSMSSFHHQLKKTKDHFPVKTWEKMITEKYANSVIVTPNESKRKGLRHSVSVDEFRTGYAPPETTMSRNRRPNTSLPGQKVNTMDGVCVSSRNAGGQRSRSEGGYTLSKHIPSLWGHSKMYKRSVKETSLEPTMTGKWDDGSHMTKSSKECPGIKEGTLVDHENKIEKGIYSEAGNQFPDEEDINPTLEADDEVFRDPIRQQDTEEQLQAIKDKPMKQEETKKGKSGPQGDDCSQHQEVSRTSVQDVDPILHQSMEDKPVSMTTKSSNGRYMRQGSEEYPKRKLTKRRSVAMAEKSKITYIMHQETKALLPHWKRDLRMEAPPGLNTNRDLKIHLTVSRDQLHKDLTGLVKDNRSFNKTRYQSSISKTLKSSQRNYSS